MITALVHPMKAAIALLCLVLSATFGYAQFDTEFWMPPIWEAGSAQVNQPSELFISTPFPEDVNVHVETADGVTFVFDGVVSSGNPLSIPLTDEIGQTDDPNVILETGLIITSDRPIQAVHKVSATNNQTLTTLKGVNGRGPDFWCGSQVRNLNANYLPEEYHFISVMAMENNTTITISTPFPMHANGGGTLSNPVVIQLNQYDSYLIRGTDTTIHLAGEHVESDKEIVVISGSTHTRISGPNNGAADGGIDQLVPIGLMGDNFVVVKGENGPTYDYAIMVATEDNTQIFVDGSATPAATINSGEFYDYTLTGAMGDSHLLHADKTSYCYHVSGASMGDEVGMSCIPQIECTGSRYIEFSRFTINSDNQIMNFIVPPEAEPTFTINGQYYQDITGIISSNVPGLTDWVTVTIPDNLLPEDNIITSEGFFHAGFLTGQSSTGTYGFLSGFDDAFEFIDPNVDLPTTVYVGDSLCQGEQVNHCLHVFSCADDHNIIDFEGNEGNVIVNPAVPGFDFDTCFQYTAPFNFVGNDTITFTVDNRFGFEGSVDVVFYVVNPDTPIDAGPVQELCSTYEATLSAVDPDPLVDGYWQVLGGGEPPFLADPNSPTTQVTGLNNGTNTFIWTQDYGCEQNIDITQIIVYDGTAPVADAGDDADLCSNNSSYFMDANDPTTAATGTWEIIQGNAVIFNINDPNAQVVNIGIGENIFEWNIENGPCPGGETSDQMIIFVYDENHPPSDAGEDQEFCDTDFTEATLSGSEPIIPAIGTWSFVQGSGIISDVNDPDAIVTGLDVGVNILRWTINNGACGELIDEVEIRIFDSALAAPEAGDDAEYCTPTTSHQLAATTLVPPSSGTWTVIEGAGTFSDINDPNAIVSNLQVGTNVIRWTMNNGPCPNDGLFDELTITIFDNTEPVADAGEDQDFCSSTFTSTSLEATAATFPASGQWTVTQGSADFSDATDPNAEIDNLSLGENILVWTVDNGPCATPSTDEVVITLFDITVTSVEAGDDAEYCTPTSTHQMNATALSAPSSGEWTLIQGTGTIDDINDPSANISGLGVGENVFRWTLINGPCEPGVYFDEVTISIFDENQEIAEAGDDQDFCFNPINPTEAIMDANTPIVPAVGTWTIVQGGGNIIDPNDPNTSIVAIPIGINIFEWTIDNGPCADAISSDQVIVNVYDNAQPEANAGADQFLCSDLPETTMDGSSITAPGSGFWTLISGSATIADPTDPNTAVTDVALGINTFEWTVNNGPCNPSVTSDQMIITVNEGAVTVANAGDDQSICSSTAQVTMSANQAVFPAEGVWSVIQGSATFDDENAHNTQVSGLSVGENVLVWTLNNGACSGFTTDEVSIFVFDENAPNADAGDDQEVCTPQTSTFLSATSATFPAVGEWTLISGTGSFADNSDPTTEVTGLSVGENVFRWTVNNAPCTPATTFDEISVFVFDITADVADAGTSQSFCSPVSSATLNANAPVFPATGQWTLVSGSGTIQSPNNNVTQVNGLGLGDNVFQWTINQAPCATSSTQSTVTITIFDASQEAANAGEDQEFCTPQSSTFLDGNDANYPASGQWVLISGTGDIADASDPNSEVTNLAVGENVFEWTINNGPCTPTSTSDQVTILVFESGDAPAAAGADQELCLPTTSTFLDGNVPTAPSVGTWTLISGAGSFQDINNPSSQVTGLAVGENVFRWTVDNGSCGSGGTFDEVSIFLFSNTSPSAMAGADQNLCTPQTSTDLEGNNPIFPATGQWTVVSGTGVFADDSDPMSEVTGLSIGENIFEWTLDNGPCPGAITSDQVSIFVFDGGAPQPEAGDDQELCTPTTTTTMTADPAVNPGVGTWTLFDGTGNIVDPNDPNTEITGLTTGVNTFVWTLDYSTCGLQQDTVRIILYDSTVDPSFAGVDQEFCSPTNTATLDADPVTSPGFGTWSLFSGNGVIDDVNDPNANLSNLTIGENQFIWTVYNGPCLLEPFTRDTVSIFIFDENQINAEAGDDQEICTPTSSVSLEGNPVTFPAIGTWTVISGSGDIVDPNDPTSEVINLTVGETVLEWSISNGNCPAGTSTDQVSIFVFDENQAAADAGSDVEFCTPIASFNLAGNSPTFPATGSWQLLSGSGNIQDPTNPTSLVTGLAVGENIFQWSISNGPCDESMTTDVVSVFVFNSFNENADAGEDQELCTPTLDTQLDGNIPIFPASGQWTLVSGSGTIQDPSNPQSTVTNLSVGVNTFEWTVLNGPCTNATTADQVQIIVFDEDAPLADAGVDQEFCSPTSTTTLQANIPVAPGSGTWTLISGTGTISDPSDPDSEVTGLSIGENVFQWTIYNGP
ncbi:MAG: IgGFc-binding protein, partial [Flavobacteriales bacterium]|nr:IgGFc-binding protein [Flavobacteriales bacterium]